MKKSVFHDHIVCLEDGRKLKMLKRHLKSAYNMTPEQYRERWGLGPDYPMVAPDYAKAPLIARQEDRPGQDAVRRQPTPLAHARRAVLRSDWTAATLIGYADARPGHPTSPGTRGLAPGAGPG